MESCMEYSIQIPTQQHCVQTVLKHMKEYNTNVLGVGAPQVHAWAALLQAVCKIENIAKEDVAVHEELCKHFAHLTRCHLAQDRDFAAAYLIRCHLKEDKEISLLKIQVVPEARALVSKVAHVLGEYCQAKMHYGPAPMAPLERQAQETLDKFLKENKDE